MYIYVLYILFRVKIIIIKYLTVRENYIRNILFERSLNLIKKISSLFKLDLKQVRFWNPS